MADFYAGKIIGFVFIEKLGSGGPETLPNFHHLKGHPTIKFGIVKQDMTGLHAEENRGSLGVKELRGSGIKLFAKTGSPEAGRPIKSAVSKMGAITYRHGVKIDLGLAAAKLDPHSLKLQGNSGIPPEAFILKMSLIADEIAIDFYSGKIHTLQKFRTFKG